MGDVAYVARMVRLARRWRPGVLHAHSGRVAALAGRIAGIPAIVETRHGLGPGAEPPDKRLLRRQARICRLAHRTIAVSRTDRARLMSAGLSPRRIVHIPNGIAQDPDAAREGSRAARDCAVRLGYVGRLSPEKNPLFLAGIAAELDREIPGRWTLAIAGEGPLRASLASSMSPWPEAVRMLGEVAETRSLLRDLDILLVPSVREGQPLSVLEAMQAGVVPLVSDLPALRELLGGEPPAGRLLPARASAWAQAIRFLLEHPQQRDVLAAEARLRVARDHDLETMVERVEQVYRDCLCA
jgi:glycosyltransferase involved in cell wall biosynthesis